MKQLAEVSLEIQLASSLNCSAKFKEAPEEVFAPVSLFKTSGEVGGVETVQGKCSLRGG